ncbi:MAG TPA: magnesium/cobalt transporter CorA, partial [Anaerolineaceae bacterium]|nr:magnesium/cobalt transporter CorA [Anaerolineaceae bacterium]
MIRSMYSPKNGLRDHDLSADQIHEALQNPEGLLWISLDNPDEKELISVLRDVFHFHPLAIEDCIGGDYQSPKVDDYGDYLFIIMHALKIVGNVEKLDTVEVNCFLGANYVVTSYQTPKLKPIDDVWDRITRDERLVNRGADFLCHGILDAVIDDYFPLLDEMDEEVELLEDSVLTVPRPVTLSRILDLKHITMELRRVVNPQREVMNRLSRDDFPQIDRQSRIYYRDIYDHLVRIQEFTDSIRDLISDALSTYLSVTSNRMNEIMKALTIVSTIFLPLSFVAGN